MSELILIVAMDRDNVIGLNNKLPWHIPADLKFFKQVTTGHTVVMGRKTYDGIGKPLPMRTNIVLTRDRNYVLDGCIVCHYIDDVLQHHIDSDCNTFIIGGSDIFNLFMPYANKMYITHIDESFKGDTYFPSIDLGQWKPKQIAHIPINKESHYELKIFQYDRLYS